MIDLGWPGHTLGLARLADDLGHHRFWTTEHHHRNQSASPTMLAALVGASTRPRGIRIGTAGVLLRYHAPIGIAADARLLELQFPGRVDLGVAGADAPDPLHEALADGRPKVGREDYERRLADVVEFVDRQDPAPDGVDIDDLGPGDGRPPVWSCTTSPAGAELAGRLGLSCAFHHHLTLSRPSTWRIAAVEAYRDAFRPSGRPGSPTEPTVVVAAYGMCVESDRDIARWLEVGGHGADEHSFLGTPDTCRDQLGAIAEDYDVDEIVVHTLAQRLPTRARSYSLLAEAVGLTARDPRHP